MNDTAKKDEPDVTKQLEIMARRFQEQRTGQLESAFDLVLDAPVDAEILETVLFLENVRVNRLESGLRFNPGTSEGHQEGITESIGRIVLLPGFSSGISNQVVLADG